MHRLYFCATIAALCSLACSGHGPEVVASFDGGTLTIADVDRALRALPENQRVIPEEDAGEWLESLVRSRAVDEILAASDSVREHLAISKNGRQWQRAAVLATMISQEIAQETVPTEEQVADQLATLEQREPELLTNFRHIFLRLDRATTESERAELRRLAERLVEDARRGADFAELARQHSQSADAAKGGLVENQRSSRLEAKAREVIDNLDEGEISDVVETRTGLHIFALERRIIREQGQVDHQAVAQRLAQRTSVAARRAELIAELHQQATIEIDEFPWQIGSYQVTKDDLAHLPGTTLSVDAQQKLIVDYLLLAAESQRRREDHELLAIDQQIDAELDRQAVRAAHEKRRQQFISTIASQRVRSIYEAQPSAFGTRERADIELIFVPQGRDSFATQRRLEDHVADLRASNEDFASLAKRISRHPSAAEGGVLGSLPPSGWTRLSPAIYLAITGLETGEISDPVYCTDRLLTQDTATLRGGFAIVRVTARHPPGPRTFDEAIDDVRHAWARANTAEFERELQDSILSKAAFQLIRIPEPAELLQ